MTDRHTRQSPQQSGGALQGIRVLDMSRVLAAPWAAQMLGDFGAEVIKVERRGNGDESRIYGPGYVKGRDGQLTRESGMYVSANRNKRSIALDLAKPEAREIILELVKVSDVLIENFLPGAMARFGLDYESLHRINPRLIYCSVTGYGQQGPYSSRPGYDTVFQAQGGLMQVTGIADGEPGGGPMRVGASIVDITTGYNAAIGILVAILERDRLSGEGQHIDLALLDSAIALQSHAVQNYLLSGVQPPRIGTAGNGGHPARSFACTDGHVYISAGNQKFYESLCEVLGREDLKHDPRFATSPLRFQNRHDWDAIAEPIIEKRKTQELLAELVAAKVPAAAVNGYADVFSDPHVQARNVKVAIEYPSAIDGQVDIVANPIRMSRTPADYAYPPPLTGEHSEAILSELLHLSADRIEELRKREVI